MPSLWARRCALPLLLLLASTALAQQPPDDPLLDQAEALLTQGDHDAAAALANVVVARNPTPRAFGVLGLALSGGADRVGAETALQRALQTPTDTWVTANRARIYQALATLAGTQGTAVAAPQTATPQATPTAVESASIPAAFLAQFPAATHEPSARSDDERRTLRVMVGLGVGFNLQLIELRDRNISIWHSVTLPLFAPNVSVIAPVSTRVEASGRLELAFGSVLASGYIDDATYAELTDADGSFLRFTLTPGLRLHPSLLSPVYLGLGARLGYLSISASGKDAYYGDGTFELSGSGVLFGAELVLGRVVGEQRGWDLNLRAQADNYSFTALIGVEGKVY